jgi:two-component system response regulator HydG
MTSPTVLIVDDDAAHAALVRDIVVSCRYEAEIALNANAALQKIKQRAYDLVITDLRMPGMDGIELIQRLRAGDPKLAIIAVTAFGTTDTGVRACQAGAGSYLTKPFRPSQLREEMENLLKWHTMRSRIERLTADVDEHLRRTKR